MSNDHGAKWHSEMDEEMDKQEEIKLEAVPVKAIRAREGKTEPGVWTARMLKALEEGVKGGKWR